MGHYTLRQAVNMRILGLDLGSKTIGVAVSDGLGITAQGLEVIRRESGKKDLERLGRIVEEYEVGEIVVGLPVNMDGTLGPQAERALAFAEKLGAALGVKVYTYDERLSTVLAQKTLIEADVSRAKRKKVIDKLAAQVILQGYLDKRKNTA